jgi:putative spermidine/putrescine transport system substrate-binding protein
MTKTTRRAVLAGVAATLPFAALPFGARGQGANDLKGTTVVFASWGGAYQEAEKASYCEPFAKATGATVVQDGPMNVAKFRAMAGSGTPDWDVVDGQPPIAGMGTSVTLSWDPAYATAFEG